MNASLTFDAWLKIVNDELAARCGLGVADLPDWTYRDAYEDEQEPREAARMMLEDTMLDDGTRDEDIDALLN